MNGDRQPFGRQPGAVRQPAHHNVKQARASTVAPASSRLCGPDQQDAGWKPALQVRPISSSGVLAIHARYSQSGAFAVCGREKVFLAWMIAGSLLIWGMGGILLVAAVKVFHHTHPANGG